MLVYELSYFFLRTKIYPVISRVLSSRKSRLKGFGYCRRVTTDTQLRRLSLLLVLPPSLRLYATTSLTLDCDYGFRAAK
jgi:hypothetical protein